MDGTFPNHEADPTVLANMTDLIKLVQSQKLDLGVGFDGDGDRIGVVDHQGNMIFGDQLMIIFAREILARKKGATFISEVKCSQTMYDDIEAHGGIYPEHVLTAAQREPIDAFWKIRGIPIIWHRVADSDRELDRALSEGRDPCRICNQSKKAAILKDFASQNIHFGSIVAIMGYSLWDIVSAVIEHLLAARFQPQTDEVDHQADKLRARYLETFQRFYPWMVFPSGAGTLIPT